MAATALAGILRRELNRPQGWRTVAGAITAKALAVLFLVFPANELLQPLLASMQGPAAVLLRVSVVLGSAVLWAVVVACLAAAFFLVLDKFSPAESKIVMAGEKLSQAFGFWVGRMRREKTGDDEHDFEITMASG